MKTWGRHSCHLMSRPDFTATLLCLALPRPVLAAWRAPPCGLAPRCRPAGVHREATAAGLHLERGRSGCDEGDTSPTTARGRKLASVRSEATSLMRRAQHSSTMHASAELDRDLHRGGLAQGRPSTASRVAPLLRTGSALDLRRGGSLLRICTEAEAEVAGSATCEKERQVGDSK
jgi:hypothetical protein